MVDASPLPVEDSRLLWGVKDTFLAYLVRMEDSRISVGHGAGFQEPNEFSFPLESSSGFETGSNTGVLVFRGQVRFTGHFGLLDLPLTNPRIEVSAAGAMLSLYVADGTDAPSIPFAELTWPEPEHTANGSRTWRAVAATLTAAAVDLFNGAYPTGEPLAPLNIELGSGPSLRTPAG